MVLDPIRRPYLALSDLYWPLKSNCSAREKDHDEIDAASKVDCKPVGTTFGDVVLLLQQRETLNILWQRVYISIQFLS